MLPDTSKVVEGFVLPIPSLLLLLSHVKLLFCIKALVPFPTNIWPLVKLVVPMPPWATFNVPNVTLLAFNCVKPDPIPEKLVAFNILLLLSHDKLADCTTVPVPLPTNNCVLFKLPVPVPPWATFNVPNVILLAFNCVKLDPIPEKLVAFNILLLLSHDKLADCITASVPLPTNNCELDKLLVPIPPWATFNVPNVILLAFNCVKLVPIPEKFVAIKVFVLLIQVKLLDCITASVPLPTNSWLLIKFFTH